VEGVVALAVMVIILYIITKGNRMTTDLVGRVHRPNLFPLRVKVSTTPGRLGTAWL
jgi:hypothetical protein